MIDRKRRRSVTIAVAGLLAVAAFGLAGCGTLKASQDQARERTLDAFSGAMRWGDFAKAGDFVDPERKRLHPLTDLDRERFKQVEVSGYDVLSTVFGPGIVDRQVRLGLINRNTQIPRSVEFHEHWHWDVTAKTWWLDSGLPDISPQQ